MMVARLLSAERVFFGLPGGAWPGVLRVMVDGVVPLVEGMAGRRDDVLAALLERESQISTGIGCGVAVPHCYLEGLDEVVAAYGRSEEGVEFDACDHAPVFHVLMLIVPEEKRGEHLQTLADIGRLFARSDFRCRLKEVDTREGVLEIFRENSVGAVGK